MSAFDRYFDMLVEQIGKLRSGSGAEIREAARLCAEAVANGGVVHIYDTGHLVSRELINRAGGPASFAPFNISLTVDNPHPVRDNKPDIRGDERAVRQFVEAAIARSNLQSGDILLIGTVSGNSASAVEVCLQAQEHGLATIAVTAVEYSKQLQARHRSGKRLYEVADLVIDNGAPFGDALLRFEGVDEPACPFSGLGAVISLWAMVAQMCELMVEAGAPPTIFPSINRPDGPEKYAAAKERYAKVGY